MVGDLFWLSSALETPTAIAPTAAIAATAAPATNGQKGPSWRLVEGDVGEGIPSYSCRLLKAIFDLSCRVLDVVLWVARINIKDHENGWE